MNLMDYFRDLDLRIVWVSLHNTVGNLELMC